MQVLRMICLKCESTSWTWIIFFYIKKSWLFIVLHNASAGESANTALTCIYIYFSCHLHLRLHHLKHKLPFAISSLLCISQTLDRDRIVVSAGWDSWGKISVIRDGFDGGEAWERDLESGEQETSEAGAKKAYATLVPDQGSKVNCFIFPFLQSSLHRRSLRHYLHSIIPSQNNPSLPKIMTNLRRNQTKILEGHSEPLLTLPVLWEAAASIYPLSNVLWAKWKAESDLQLHLLSKLLLEDLEAEQVPIGPSSSPTSVGSVRSPGSPSANTGTPSAKGQS